MVATVQELEGIHRLPDLVKVNVTRSTKHPQGFAITFPYSEPAVENIRKVLGLSWNKSQKAWESEGPEVLLDFQRFGIEIQRLSPQARELAEDLRQRIWTTYDYRSQPIDDEEYGFQKWGSLYLSAMPNVILADDMGTGKSKQSLDAAEIVGAESILIFCPKTLTENWVRQIKLWHPDWQYGVLPDSRHDYTRHGEHHIGRSSFWRNPPMVVIANYEKAILNDWPKRDWDVLILDEANKLKNSSTVTFKNIKAIRKRSLYTWALTGTPLEIRVSELYNILGMLRPAVLGNYMRFMETHVATDWDGTVVGAKNLDLLRDRIGPFMLRRTKKEVLKQLPPKLPPELRFVQFSEREEKEYFDIRDEFNNWLDERGISSMGADPTLRLRQYCCTPNIWGDDIPRGSKFEALQEIIDNWEGRVVVFCFFTEVTKRLHKWLGAHPEAYIDGEVKNELRIPRTIAFNEGKLDKVFVSSDAGGVGIDLWGADLVIHYDQLWNPMKMNQREDRLHRIGQTLPVNVIHLMYENSVDYGIYLRNLSIRDMDEEVIDGTEIAMLQKLDAARLKKIVEGRI